MATSGVKVKGMRELQRALVRTSKEARKQTRSTFKEVAEPVRRDAENYAHSRIVDNSGGPWSQMRVGVTSKAVYVAPKARGRRGHDPRKRPKFGDLLMDRAMEPALEQNADQIVGRVDRALDQLATQFERN